MPEPKPSATGLSLPELSRRDIIRLLSGAVALPLLSSSALAMLHGVHQQINAETPPGGTALKVLNPHQNATVAAISEWIIPATDTPGAKAARVNEFIDLLLAEWYSPPERDQFLKDLDQADAECKATYGAVFLDCTSVQQKQMLSYWDEHLTRTREAATPFTGENRYHPKPVETSFFRAMKHLTLVGFFTSEIGATQVLHYEVVPTSHGACVTIAPAATATPAEAAK